MPIGHWSDAVSDMSVDESELVGRVAVGDHSALETLYHGYYQRLTNFLWRAIGHRKSVEEIIYDTFTWVWKSAGNFQEAELVSTWIFRIAYGKALEYLCQPRNSSAWSDMRHPSDQAKDALDDAEIGDALSQGLRAMPLEQRLALLLTYQMGYGLEEVAAITGVRAEAVMAQMLRARDTLRCFLLAGGTNVSEPAER
jgi:RNA polymerase sigma-70 factor, ECF subfamily